LWGGFLAEIIGEYGGMTGGGDLSPEYVYGVPYSTWMGWSEYHQQEYLTDYYRTETQQYYYTGEEPAAHKYILAYQKVGEGYDFLREEGWETLTDYGQEKISDLFGYLAVLGVIYVATRK